MAGRGIACAAVGIGSLLLSGGSASGRDFLAPLTHGTAKAPARSIAISPDGTDVYVAALDAKLRGGVTTFARDPATGSLTRLSCIRSSGEPGCERPRGGVEGARDTALAVSGDGRFVALASSYRLGRRARYPAGLTIYHRDPGNGSLAFAGCASEPPAPAGCAASSHIAGATHVTFGPASDTVYVLGGGAKATELEPTDAGIAILALDTGGVPVETGCVTERGADGECVDGIGLEASGDFSLSRDGRTLDVVGTAIGVASFSVSPAGGGLTPAGCFSRRDASGTGYRPACERGFSEASRIAPGPGEEMLVTALTGIHTVVRGSAGQPLAMGCQPLRGRRCGSRREPHAGAIASAADGRRGFVSSYAPEYADLLFSLTVRPGGRLRETGCIAHTLRGAVGLGCTTGLRELTGMVASPDGESVYTVTANSPLHGIDSYGLAAGVVSGRAAGRGRARVVRVRCSSTRRHCRGTVELRLLAHRRVRGRREPALGAVIGSGRYSAAPGQTRSVVVGLRRPLDGRLRAALARVTDATGTAGPTVTRMKLR